MKKEVTHLSNECTHGRIKETPAAKKESNVLTKH
jgi:hypothetical protein